MAVIARRVQLQPVVGEGPLKGPAPVLTPARLARTTHEVLKNPSALHGVRAAEGDVGESRILDGRDLLLGRQQIDQFVPGTFPSPRAGGALHIGSVE